ncbi:hypothetical protein [Nostoc parmelioides]|uniref:Uncharacterized protein n=1 Tax=Nostoc parmelioides FACHB-3921 TaxID=2692909 RepID=A0ABR8BQ06_9NOSO|nr:hypothetical protein [Nostoc parmelioides]MBD2255875.1 hypothetical protein [Nostoc parmelioides FACHB-3921]
MNRLTLAKLKKIAAEKGYIVQFEGGCYKIFQKVAEFNSLSDAESYLSWPIPPCLPLAPQRPVPPAPPKQPNPQYDLTQIWERCLHHIPQGSHRVLIGQMCHLASFDGESASIYCKPAWYDKIKTRLTILDTAFKNAFGRDIAITLLKTTGLPAPSPTPRVLPTPTPAPPTSSATPITPLFPLPHTSPPSPPLSKASAQIHIPLLKAGKYRIRVLENIIKQGYPELDGKNYLDVLKTVHLEKLLDSYTLSVEMKLSVVVNIDSDRHWLLNFLVVSLAIQSLKDGHCLLVVLQPIPRLTTADHYLYLRTEEIF